MNYLQTDPENTDYIMEEGATRNFEAFRLAKLQQEKLKQEKEEEELNNPMKVRNGSCQYFLLSAKVESNVLAHRDISVRNGKIA